MKQLLNHISLLLALTMAGFYAPVLANEAPVAADKFGIIEKVPAKPGPHWLWVYDTNFISMPDGRAHLIDGDTGKYFGTLNTGYVHTRLNLPSHYREIYSAETYYTRHVGGTRTDLVRVYDPINLSLLKEIEIPPKRGATIPRMLNTGLTPDDKFLLVFNITPAASISVIDLEKQEFINEIGISGCALAIPVDNRRFFSLCGDGTALVITLNDKGELRDKKRTKQFFDKSVDPITENGVRYNNQWLFPSFASYIYAVDVSGKEFMFHEPWSLLDDTDREQNWRTGGMQQIAINEKHGLLYSIMHQGTVDTYEHAGPEIWVYDLNTKKRINRIKTERMAISIHVSPDDRPLLFSLPDTEATLDIYDALTGKHLRSMLELGVTPVLMETPPH